MKVYTSSQIIEQLEKRKGSYFFLKIDAETVNQFRNKRQTRFLCTLDGILTFQCGLNHLGDGNFFIILSTKNLQTIGKSADEKISFELKEDPNPLGVEIPEVLAVVLEDDESLKQIFENLTPGKKRNLIHSINRIKDVDRQIRKTIKLINDRTKPRPKRLS